MSVDAELVGQEKLQKIIDDLQEINKKGISDKAEKQALNKIGVAWTGSIKTNISNGISYNGQPLLRPKRRDGEPLQDSGRLVSSINPIVSGNILRIGTPVYYSPWLNNGTQKMKARPFIPEEQDQIPDRWWKVAQEIVLKIAMEDIEEKLK